MACLKLPLPSLPPLPGLSFLPFTLPSFGLNAAFCCHFSIVLTPPIRIPGIPILAAALAVINAEIALVDAYLQALDLSFSCPFDESATSADLPAAL